MLDAVQMWKARRMPAIERERVALTIRGLNALGWLDAAASAELPLPEEALA